MTTTPVQALHSARGGRSRALTFWLHQETRRLALRPASCVGCLLRVPTNTSQVTRPHTRAANPHSAGHATTHSGTVPTNGREQTQELHLSKVLLTLPYFLTSTSETSCWRSYGGRYGYEPTLT